MCDVVKSMRSNYLHSSVSYLMHPSLLIQFSLRQLNARLKPKGYTNASTPSYADPDKDAICTQEALALLSTTSLLASPLQGTRHTFYRSLL